ncbi:hypothetical protein AtNW77_Chr2g0234651 [Arabidopsis thaliana]|uniref:Uncharacterized protein n=2 Tax=Arabidopsis TaxID=3701 RepID=A0A178VQS6_ARATH|nr:hypothetical protein ISN45_At02g010700 [Arabidopsis thaliana x Arabidopsis arenosa]OAP08679.1 hypothetical protein AXX17_AT2G12310 [Arabidopsis thaliana]
MMGTKARRPNPEAPVRRNGKFVTELMNPNLQGKFSTEEAFLVFKLASECLQCEHRKSLITKELVATLKALQTKPHIPTSEMTKQNLEASSSSQTKA